MTSRHEELRLAGGTCVGGYVASVCVRVSLCQFIRSSARRVSSSRAAPLLELSRGDPRILCDRELLFSRPLSPFRRSPAVRRYPPPRVPFSFLSYFRTSSVAFFESLACSLSRFTRISPAVRVNAETSFLASPFPPLVSSCVVPPLSALVRTLVRASFLFPPLARNVEPCKSRPRLVSRLEVTRFERRTEHRRSHFPRDTLPLSSAYDGNFQSERRFQETRGRRMRRFERAASERRRSFDLRVPLISRMKD